MVLTRLWLIAAKSQSASSTKLEMLANETQPTVTFNYTAGHKRITNQKDNSLRNIFRLSDPTNWGGLCETIECFPLFIGREPVPPRRIDNSR
jgi:hypothetical protein